MNTTYQRMYVDKPDEWEDVDVLVACEKIGRYYDNPNEILAYLRDNPSEKIRTPWAFYRVKPEAK